MAEVVNVNDVLEGHVALDLDCLDRIYLNAYVPNLQVGGQVVQFLNGHLGHPVPSPALFMRIGEHFREAVKAFAEAHAIPLLHLKKPDRSRWDDRKLDHVRPFLERATEPGVVAIVVAQEFQYVFTGANRATKPGAVNFAFEKSQRRVSTYYFYVRDAEFGSGFIKICSYFPYPAKVWVNGHEWAKCQARKQGIPFHELANGFASCPEPARLQAICDRLGPADLEAFFDRWLAVIPRPFTDRDRAAGYWWELSMRQVEMSRTIVLDDPRRARGFFESLVADNIGIGRPHEVSAVFARRVQKNTPGIFRTRVFGPGTEVKLDLRYKQSRVKQYLKEGRAIRVESVINDPADIGVKRRVAHLPELCEKARAVNHRLLMIERAGQGCAIGSALFERIQLPYVREGQRTGALRFGDLRVMALAGALCLFVHAVSGFRNQSLRGLVAEMLGVDYTAAQMSYDLRRLRLHGLIERLPHTNTYVPTTDGLRVALFYTKVDARILRPLLAADRPPSPPELRAALRTIDRAIQDYVTNARLGVAA
jgi:hypothetical protein